MKPPRQPGRKATPSPGWSPIAAGARHRDEAAAERSAPRQGEPDGTSPRKKTKDDWKLKSPRRKFREQRDGRGRPSQQSTGDDGLHLLYGIHSVREALRNPRRSLKRLLATENGALRLQEDGPLPLTPTIVKPDEIGRRLSADAVHQGVLLEAEPLAPIGLTDIAKNTIVLALDQVTDPHNVGAILRSCAAFNVGALLITERHSPEVTGVLAKAASGALEHVPFAVVRNLSDALEKLKGRGFACIGLDSEAERPIG